MTTPTPTLTPALTVSAPPAQNPAAFFEAAYQTFQAALAQAGPHEEHFVIGGQRVRLLFAGRAWVPQYTAALAHLAAPPSAQPDLTIGIWDDASTGTHMPSPPWSRDDYTPRGEITSFCQAGYRAAFQVDSALLSMLDTPRGLGLVWSPDAVGLPRYELTFPARPILHWWADSLGMQMIHAGAVGNATGGVLLAGKGGSGKSTTALTCLEAGLDYAGDDYVLFGEEPTPRAYSVYCTGKLNADHVGRLPAYVPIIHNKAHLGPEKALLYLSEHYAGRLAADLPLTAIVLPRVTGAARTSYRPVSTVLGLATMAGSTLRQLPDAGETDHVRMRRLASRLPAYALELGQDIENIPAVVTQLIAESIR